MSSQHEFDRPIVEPRSGRGLGYHCICGYTREQIEDGVGPRDCPGQRLKAVDSFDEIRANLARIQRDEGRTPGREGFIASVEPELYRTSYRHVPDGVALTSMAHPNVIGVDLSREPSESALIHGEYDDETGKVRWSEASDIGMCPCGCGMTAEEAEIANKLNAPQLIVELARRQGENEAAAQRAAQAQMAREFRHRAYGIRADGTLGPI